MKGEPRKQAVIEKAATTRAADPNASTGAVSKLVYKIRAPKESNAIQYRYTNVMKTLGVPAVPMSWRLDPYEAIFPVLHEHLYCLQKSEVVALSEIGGLRDKLCHGATQPAFLDAVYDVIRAGLSEFSPAVYKIGVSANLPFRVKTYLDNNYDELWLLGAFTSATACKALERHLIGCHNGIMGCRNTAPGGEGNMAEDKPPFYCYIAIAWAAKRSRIGA